MHSTSKPLSAAGAVNEAGLCAVAAPGAAQAVIVPCDLQIAEAKGLARVALKALGESSPQILATPKGAGKDVRWYLRGTPSPEDKTDMVALSRNILRN